ncbi:MAG TPA: PD-(D/E)XK nuclease-like domain-containing protein [Polyangiales bacterium]|nr:PD-(D/E)XK nuclease-like domain-containing protein [Polyangiales bacterium]
MSAATKVEPFVPTEGMHLDLPMEVYRAAEGVAASDLKNMQRSPAFARMRSHVTSPSKEWGTAVHTAVLEPHALEDRYGLDPESPKGGYPAGWRNTKDYKAQRAELFETQPTLEGLLTPQEFQDLGRIQTRVRESEVGEMIEGVRGEREASVWHYDDEFSLWRKVRPDYLISAARMVVDLKTAVDHRERAFSRACHNYGYHVSDAYYRDTITAALDFDVDFYLFLVVASDAPFEVAGYVLDNDSVKQGRHEYRHQLAKWRECEERQRWPGGIHDITEIRLPEYGINYMNGDI